MMMVMMIDVDLSHIGAGNEHIVNSASQSLDRLHLVRLGQGLRSLDRLHLVASASQIDQLLGRVLRPQTMIEATGG